MIDHESLYGRLEELSQTLDLNLSVGLRPEQRTEVPGADGPCHGAHARQPLYTSGLLSLVSFQGVFFF